MLDWNVADLTPLPRFQIKRMDVARDIAAGLAYAETEEGIYLIAEARNSPVTACHWCRRQLDRPGYR
jgi:hypothetical protein